MKSEKLNGTQKLEALESKLIAVEEKLDRAIELLLNRVNALGETDVSLAKRINAIVAAGDEGGVNTEAVKHAVVNQTVKELKAKVDMLVDNNLMVRDDTSSIHEESFFVLRELTSDGTEINPRLQGAVKALSEADQIKITGSRLGDRITDEKTNSVLEILEIYTLVHPKVEEVPEEVEEAATESSIEAPKKTRKLKRA